MVWGEVVQDNSFYMTAFFISALEGDEGQCGKMDIVPAMLVLSWSIREKILALVHRRGRAQTLEIWQMPSPGNLVEFNITFPLYLSTQLFSISVHLIFRIIVWSACQDSHFIDEKIRARREEVVCPALHNQLVAVLTWKPGLPTSQSSSFHLTMADSILLGSRASHVPAWHREDACLFVFLVSWPGQLPVSTK